MENSIGSKGGCPNFGHRDEAGKVGGEQSEQMRVSVADIDNPEVDEMLRALAGVVVDELMLLKRLGMTPAEIRKMYSDLDAEMEKRCE